MKQRETLSQGIDRINDVVQLADERVNVFSIERGDEGAIETIECGMGEVIGLVFFVADQLNSGVNPREFGGQLLEVCRRCDNMLGDTLEQVEKDSVFWQEIE